MLNARFVQAQLPERGHVAEDRILAFPLQIVPARDLNASARWIGHIRKALPYKDQPGGVGVGKGRENHRVDHAEDGGVRADA